MGIFVLLGLEPIDAFVFFVSDVLGFLAGMWLLQFNHTVAGLAVILIPYHLFLAWLVISADRKTGISLPFFSTVATHLACMAIVAFIAFGHRIIPFYGILRYGVPALAVFERYWLFSVSQTSGEFRATPISEAAVAAEAEATAEDYEAWHRHLATRNPLSVKRGMTVKDEYEQFILARAKKRAALAAGNRPA